MNKRQRRQPFLDRLRYRNEIVVDDQNPGAGILQNVLQFRQREPRVERHHRAAGPGDRIIDLEIAMAVQCKDGDAAAFGKACLAQQAGGARNAHQRFAPREAMRAVDECDAGRFDLRCTTQPLCEASSRHVVPFIGMIYR